MHEKKPKGGGGEKTTPYTNQGGLAQPLMTVSGLLNKKTTKVKGKGKREGERESKLTKAEL